MIGLLSIAINGILSVFIMYHIIRYGKREPKLLAVGFGYLVVVLLCASLLIVHSL
jgi:hypothetical protein